MKYTEKKYEPRRLERAVYRYFDSITRDRVVTEKVPSGELDKYGHVIYRDQAVTSNLGCDVIIVEYLVPPTEYDLCCFLRITPQTWEEYKDAEAHPEYARIVRYVQERFKAWFKRELLMREGKDLKGIIFELENNYGYSEHSSVSVGGTIEEYLKKLSEEGGSETGAAVQEF